MTWADLDHEHEGEGERGQDEEDGEEGDQVGAQARALITLHVLGGESLPTLLMAVTNQNTINQSDESFDQSDEIK